MMPGRKNVINNIQLNKQSPIIAADDNFFFSTIEKEKAFNIEKKKCRNLHQNWSHKRSQMTRATESLLERIVSRYIYYDAIKPR